MGVVIGFKSLAIKRVMQEIQDMFLLNFGSASDKVFNHPEKCVGLGERVYQNRYVYFH